LPLAIGRLAATRAELRALAVRDVVVVDGGGAILVGRGAVPVALAIGAARVTVRGAYARGQMDETLGDDMTIEVAAVAGAVELSLRRALELTPGEVLGLGRPLGGPIELRVGSRVIARGELVDVDGELGVRIVEVTAAPTR
ncbi:MAG: FliM/FliN family flagellar motor C-terminal domain-containing protein, partial [Deltaproteobacteria bacterium]|nr:FliM/FliN family flagellar motor C-terminal domain-containing protein [Deltaproteobacteria bacterium]